MVPGWLHELSIFSLVLAFVCSAIIAWDEIRDPQHMWVMNVVWPVAALFGSAIWLAVYFTYGKLATRRAILEAKRQGKTPPSKRQTPFPVMVFKGTSHCGSGCTLGDIVAEWLLFAAPAIALWLGWKSIFSEKIFSVWTADFVLAFLVGIAFQYFTIKPMRSLTRSEGIIEALKADTLSLVAWQVGMYGFMAVAYFWIFRQILGADLRVNSFEFWFMMQIAMYCGFITSYPVNWWLISSGIKERM